MLPLPFIAATSDTLSQTYTAPGIGAAMPGGRFNSRCVFLASDLAISGAVKMRTA
jgi:hypothetical protein